ncbi:MAG: hypothetical protein F9K40_07170 [Kofleriaceae bacterium]|nr:MAG: hypothetical protein F9K40_07170 [Kofleriaceae bacterium]
MLMSADGYRESLRAYRPRVFVNGARIDSVADEPLLAPGINAVGVTYDFALRDQHRTLMTARQSTSGQVVNRMLHVNETSTDLLYKLEAVRLLCAESGCAQRYLTHDALNGIFQATARTDAVHGTDYHQRFLAYLHDVQDRDLTLGVAMTDAKGDRSLKPGQQANPDVYVHIARRRPDGIVIRGTKAIVTGAPYMHEFLVMPCRTHTAEDRDFAVACAVPADARAEVLEPYPAEGYRRGKKLKLQLVQIGWAEVELETARAFLAMREAAAADGIDLAIRSGWRSHERQAWLYQAWRMGLGNKAARPGYSNHQAGRALDIYLDAPTYAWLEKNARRFGFRRTVRKEPWHWERVKKWRPRVTAPRRGR